MNWADGAALDCASSRHVDGHEESKSGCWATGKKNGFIFFEKKVLAHGVLFSLEIQYVESMQKAMNEVVFHAAASWRQ